MSRPQLAVVVDTEEEFDWSQPFSRDSRSTDSIAEQALAHRIYDRFGLVPTYVIDHPVATSPRAQDFLGSLQAEGKAEIGAHLHPWVTPPHDEQVSTHNSYHCNLPPELERAKIEALTAAIEQGFGRRPSVFKAGRYGFGPNTARVLAELGYRVDSSYVPHVSFEGDGGPNYYGVPDQPFWLDQPGGLLEVPTTSGYIGHAAALAHNARRLFDSPHAARLRLTGLLARSGLVARTRLTPEGVPASEQCRLIETLAQAGRSTFVMAYHSPSLAPGNTPYVRTEADLAAFLGAIEQVLDWFRNSLGGRFVTLSEIDAQQRSTAAAA